MRFAASDKTSASPSQRDENSTDDQHDADDRIGGDRAAEYEGRQNETADRGQRQYLSCRRGWHHSQHLAPEKIAESSRDNTIIGKDRDNGGRPMHRPATDRP